MSWARHRHDGPAISPESILPKNGIGTQSLRRASRLYSGTFGTLLLIRPAASGRRCLPILTG